jgi:hypothetical protein
MTVASLPVSYPLTFIHAPQSHADRDGLLQRAAKELAGTLLRSMSSHLVPIALLVVLAAAASR